MVSGAGDETATLARDTVFAAVMITCNGILGLCLIVGALRRRLAAFNAEGTATALATVCTLATLTLVLPTFTESAPGPEFTSAQLAFAAVASIALYGLFVFVQADPPPRLLPAGRGGRRARGHAEPPTAGRPLEPRSCSSSRWSPSSGSRRSSRRRSRTRSTPPARPQSAVGVIIALLVLAPETLAAVRNARRDRIQTSFNLAFGSAIASIGLTIPAIAVASIWVDGPLVLGLEPTQMVLLAITAVVGALTVLPGRATLQEGGVHLALFAAFLFLAVVP